MEENFQSSLSERIKNLNQRQNALLLERQKLQQEQLRIKQEEEKLKEEEEFERLQEELASQTPGYLAVAQDIQKEKEQREQREQKEQKEQRERELAFNQETLRRSQAMRSGYSATPIPAMIPTTSSRTGVGRPSLSPPPLISTANEDIQKQLQSLPAPPTTFGPIKRSPQWLAYQKQINDYQYMRDRLTNAVLEGKKVPGYEGQSAYLQEQIDKYKALQNTLRY